MENAVRRSYDSDGRDLLLYQFRTLQFDLHSERLQDCPLAEPKLTWASWKISARRKTSTVSGPANGSETSVCSEESHCDYLPYTAEAEAQLRSAGRLVSIVEISYKLSATVY
jgi:hypothetical protein